MSDPRDPLVPGNNPLVPPPAEAPAPPLTDRAAEDAARAEAERLERVRLQDAIDLISTHYNAQGGMPPPAEINFSP